MVSRAPLSWGKRLYGLCLLSTAEVREPVHLGKKVALRCKHVAILRILSSLDPSLPPQVLFFVEAFTLWSPRCRWLSFLGVCRGGGGLNSFPPWNTLCQHGSWYTLYTLDTGKPLLCGPEVSGCHPSSSLFLYLRSAFWSKTRPSWL